MFAPHRSQASAYSRVNVETGVENADQHQLVSMLLDGAMTQIATAVAAIERRDLPAKCKAITHAASIVDEGLRSVIDLQRGGEVARSLHTLYTCVLMRLTEANLKSDAALLRECVELLAPVRDAWRQIRPQALAA
jgi:flagellar protein FliS